MGLRKYVVQPGDTFYVLAKRLGGRCEDWIQANPQINPQSLQVGEVIVLPAMKAGAEQYVQVSPREGREYSGEHMDEIEMELAGVQFKLRRIGESRVPHEIHMIMPRAEIHKIQPQGENGPTELRIMLSNINIVHSPRLQSEGGESAESGKQSISQPAEEAGRGSQTQGFHSDQSGEMRSF